MKRVLSSWWAVACFACASLLSVQALAKEAVPLAQEPEVEARLVKIAEELRCMVCQNESLASSHAELAEDLRREVRSLIKEGKNDVQVKEFLVARYGDYVLYRPEVKPLTWVLWFGPFLLFLIAVTGLLRYLRQRQIGRAHV